MKKAINIIILGICFLVSAQLRGGMMYTLPDTFILEIDGKVINSKLGDGITRIELLYNNEVVDSFVMKDRKKFSFTLKKNVQYTIRLSKKGYYDRLITVDTKTPVYSGRVYRFSFQTRLISETATIRLNKNLLKAPIAKIYYDEKKKNFSYSKKYTSGIKKELAMK